MKEILLERHSTRSDPHKWWPLVAWQIRGTVCASRTSTVWRSSSTRAVGKVFVFRRHTPWLCNKNNDWFKIKHQRIVVRSSSFFTLPSVSGHKQRVQKSIFAGFEVRLDCTRFDVDQIHVHPASGQRHEFRRTVQAKIRHLLVHHSCGKNEKLRI